MKKFGLSLLFAVLMLAMFATAASAAPGITGTDGPTTPAQVAEEDQIATQDTSNELGVQNQTMESGKAGKTITNANRTGEGVDLDGNNHDTVVKNKTGQNTHTSYQNNTNSCASCHQTHTAKGDQLLFADGVYQTCSACHDGTLGFLNVFSDGSLDAATSAKTTGAGTFGGSHGASMHMANDAVKVSAAPGGNPLEGDKTNGSMWGESFNCASCHAPHGSYSDRLLQYNPNGIGAIPVSKGGLQLENVPVVTALPAMTTAEEKAAAPAIVLLVTEDTVADANGHKKVTVAQYNKGTSSYTKSTAPWLYGYDVRTDGMTYWSRLVKGVVLGDNPATTDVVETNFIVNNGTIAAYGSTAGVYFDYDQAQAYSTTDAGGTALKSATSAWIARPVVVKMAKSGYNVVQSAYFAGAPLAQFNKGEQQLKDLGYKVGTDANKTVTNVGVMMSKFCAACHTDYLQANADGKKSHFGDETAAYRHSTNSDSYTCVRCHYGHGTDAYIMKDSLGRTIADLTNAATMAKYTDTTVKTEPEAITYMQDNNASSALKRFTNMSVCWACHNSSHAETIKNTDRAEGHPVGMPAGN